MSAPRGPLDVLTRLRRRQEWQLFAALFRADPAMATAWWAVLITRGVLPAAFAVATGALVGAVQDGREPAGPLAAVGIVFVLVQVLVPIHQAIGTNLGDRTAAWLYDRLTAGCVGPPGMGHLEDPDLAADLTAARDFDLGMTGPGEAARVPATAHALATSGIEPSPATGSRARSSSRSAARRPSSRAMA